MLLVQQHQEGGAAQDLQEVDVQHQTDAPCFFCPP